MMHEPPSDDRRDDVSFDEPSEMPDFGASGGSGEEYVQAPSAHQEPLDDLTLPLTIRCGALCLTLGELRQLDEGSLITLTGVQPGMASLYHGERPIAHGELVSIDGQLGLQISQVEFQQVVVKE